MRQAQPRNAAQSIGCKKWRVTLDCASRICITTLCKMFSCKLLAVMSWLMLILLNNAMVTAVHRVAIVNYNTITYINVRITYILILNLYTMCIIFLKGGPHNAFYSDYILVVKSIKKNDYHPTNENVSSTSRRMCPTR